MDNNTGSNANENQQTFIPKDNMIKVLKAFCSPDTDASITARMAEAGVDRSIWYDWIKIDGFLDWWNSQVNEFAKSQISELIKLGIRRAKKPSSMGYYYWRDMMKKYGGLVDKYDLTSGGKPLEHTPIESIAILLSETYKQNEKPKEENTNTTTELPDAPKPTGDSSSTEPN